MAHRGQPQAAINHELDTRPAPFPLIAVKHQNRLLLLTCTMQCQGQRLEIRGKLDVPRLPYFAFEFARDIESVVVHPSTRGGRVGGRIRACVWMIFPILSLIHI